MPQLKIPRNYSIESTPTEQQLDAARLAVESFFNLTKAGEDNLSAGFATAQEIASGAVTGSRIAPNQVLTSRLSDSAVTTSKLAAPISMDKVSDQAVPPNKVVSKLRAKVGPVTQTVATETVLLSSGPLHFSGRPVLILPMFEPGGSWGRVDVSFTGGGTWRVYRDSALVHDSRLYLGPSGSGVLPFTRIWPSVAVDVPPPGVYTYTLRLVGDGGVVFVGAVNLVMAIVEL